MPSSGAATPRTVQHSFAEFRAVQRVDVEGVDAARDEVRHLLGRDRRRNKPVRLLVRVEPVKAARQAVRDRRAAAAGEIADRRRNGGSA